MKHLWTLEEAESALPEVIRLLEHGRALIAEAVEAKAQLEDLEAVTNGTPPADGPEAEDFRRFLALYQQSVNEFQATMRRLAKMHVEVKEIHTGLVDFRSRLGDQVVYLCYRLGEDRIGHWHPLDGGFAGRKPLPQIDLD